MRIALYGKTFGCDYDRLMRDVLAILRENNVEITVYKPFWENIGQCFDEIDDYQCFETAEELKDNVDMLFSFGGDGTILDSVPLIGDSGIPVLGINTGNLGFLASVSTKETCDAVRKILSGDYAIESRTMLQIEDENNIFNGINYSLNEISICRKDNGSLIVVNVFIDDVFLNTYWADGVLIATPTGSTAYSMSVGGPIMTPNTDSFLITPVAAHNLSVRPLVIPDRSTIRIKVDGRCDTFALGLDSRIFFVNKSMEIVIKKTDFSFNMVKLPEKEFFCTIRNKLLWGNDVRN